MISKKEYKECLDYIQNYWEKITFYLPKDRKIHIGLPHSFVSPNDNLFKFDQFYWDSFFIILGLIVEKKFLLAKGIVENFFFLYRKFGIIPSRNKFYNLGISQIPFLSSMILEIYKVFKDKKWLKRGAKIVEDELKNYWMNGDHLVYQGLSRYCDHFMTHLTAEHEAGWDMTSRFNEKCLNYLPVDLNTCLYKYEIDLAEIYRILGDTKKEKEFEERAKKRKEKINSLMWDENLGFFFDYNYKEKRKSNFFSVAGFYPLWAKLCSFSQAKKIKKNLKIFEKRGGIANTQKENLSKEFKQHDYPNGWPNQQWIVIKGLLNYGFREDAKRLTKKWLDLNKKIFKKTGNFWEKYDVVNCDVGKSGRYKTQSGFGWTNAIFVKLLDEFSKN